MATRLLIVDDSAIVRKVLSQRLGEDADIEVVGTAPDPLVASEKIERLNPDILTLDVEMPRMDGITFLKGLMRHHPLPVIIVSSITPKGGRLAIQALESGALDVVCKPGAAYSAGAMAGELAEKIRALAGARAFRPAADPVPAVGQTILPALGDTSSIVVAIAASTGGTRALGDLLPALPPDFPGTMVVQHMPAGFTRSFAQRLNETCALEVLEAEDGMSVIPGRVLIAPGNRHLVLSRSGARCLAKVVDGPRVRRQRPSADVLFDSVAAHAGTNAIGVILTGMGADGAAGMFSMKERGATTFAQDEGSCVVFGMPKEAIQRGGVDRVLSLHKIPEALAMAVAQRLQKGFSGGQPGFSHQAGSHD